MASLIWKSCVVAHGCHPRDITLSVTQMRQAGWEEFFVFVGSGTKAPERNDCAVSRIRSVKPQDDNADYVLFYSALEAMTTGFMKEASLLFFCRPGMYCWEQLQHYCEAQIELSRTAVWCVHTPTSLINSERQKRPEAYNGDGFYRVNTGEQLLSCDTLVMTPVAAKVLISLLPPPDQGLFKTFAHAVGFALHNMPTFELYYHIRSLVSYENQDCPDFVGVSYVMPNRELTDLKPLNH